MIKKNPMGICKDDWGCLCFTYRFKIASQSPNPVSGIYKKSIWNQNSLTVFFPMANPSSVSQSAVQGLSETEASKRLLYLVAISSFWRLFILSTFCDNEDIRTCLFPSEMRNGNNKPYSPSSYLSWYDILPVHLLLAASFWLECPLVFNF